MNESNQSGEYKDFHRRVVADAIKKSKFASIGAAEVDHLFGKTEAIVAQVLRVIRPVVAAGGAAKAADREAGLRQLVFRNLLEGLDALDKGEMHTLLTCLLAERIMVDVEARPFGGGPDLLSEQ